DGGKTFSRNTAVSTAPSCPPKEMPPHIIVKNVTPDSTLPTADSLNVLIANRRFGEAEQLNLALEQRTADAGVEGTRLRVSFNPGRSVWPGHYTGLAPDST